MEKGKIKNFTDLIIWQKAIELFEKTVADVEEFPNKRAAWIITDQVIRSVGSIGSNIAEGFGRGGQREYRYHLGVAKGSASESQDWYYKVGRLKYLPENLIKERINVLTEIIKMLNSLISKIH
jgi:four helix bundle protein